MEQTNIPISGGKHSAAYISSFLSRGKYKGMTRLYVLYNNRKIYIE